jgi:zinc transport system substrate-binding protein
MKKLFLLQLLLTTFILANINVVVSILPEKSFVKAIGGDGVDVTLMVPPGASPHTYEPKPSQMREAAHAQLYFAIGVEFEHTWLPRFKDLNPSMKIVDLTEGIEKLPMAPAHHHESEHHDQEGLDPHIWTAPENVRIIARHIYTALSHADPAHDAYYKQNLTTFLAQIDRTDRTIRSLLAPLQRPAAFMVFHPSWGYFAKAYDLVQVPVEVEGKKPKPRELVMLIKEAQAKKIRAIFTQPEFSDSSAKIIASELHIPVIKISPLAADWSENLIRIAKAIAGVN